MARDGSGVIWPTKPSFAFLKDLADPQLVVPIVGDFGGPKALRAVAQYAREHGAIVSAFYLSNVEKYLRQDGKWNAFCASVADDAARRVEHVHPIAVGRRWLHLVPRIDAG